MAEHRPTDEQLRDWANPDGTGFPAYWESEHYQYLEAMAAELLALRARVSSWSDRLQELTAHGAELDRRGRELEAAQREPIGYGVVVEGTEGVGGLWVQTSPLLREADAIDRAKFYAHQGARAVAMTEVVTE